MSVQNMKIKKDVVSTVLRRRWMACYMLYDWNFYHADCAFQSNESERYQKVCERLEGASERLPETGKKQTEAYNRVLLEDVEEFIRLHIEMGYPNRLEVEYQMARAAAAVFLEVKDERAECF